MFPCLKRRKPPVKTPDLKPGEGKVPDFTPPELAEKLVRQFNNLEIEVQGRQKRSHVAWYVKKALSQKEHYLKVQAFLRVELGRAIDWRIIAALHGMEASFDLSKSIHSGEPWNRKTKLVPKGRGPFSSFEEACLDAFGIKRRPSEWDIANTLNFCERFNGLGYRRKRMNSPYIWSYSNYQPVGKYVRDHVFDPKAVSLQVGVAVILKELGFKGV